MNRWLVCLLMATLQALLCGSASAQESVCGPLTHGYGPFDYRTASAEEKLIVERRHFTRNVESLTKGETGWLGGDLNYTLRAFPNHPRALTAMARLARREGKPQPVGADFPIDCYFERAIRFRPDDAQVRIVYGIELLKDGKRNEAIEQLQIAQKLAGDDANVNYNLGLAYFELADYPRARDYAHKAYAGGFPLPGLRNMLQRVNQWKE